MKLSKKERLNLSLSPQNKQELKIILLNKNKYELKVADRIHLSGHKLIKYLMVLGLEELQNKHGEINKIFKNEGIFANEK